MTVSSLNIYSEAFADISHGNVSKNSQVLHVRSTVFTTETVSHIFVSVSTGENGLKSFKTDSNGLVMPFQRTQLYQTSSAVLVQTD